MDSLRIQGCQEEEKIDRKQGWNRILKLIYLSFETAESQLINELDIIILGICAEKNQSIILSGKDFPDAGKISGVREHLSLS